MLRPKRRKIKNQFAKLVRKHILPPKKFGIDLEFLKAVVELKGSLEQNFEGGITLGQKYKQCGRNLWVNEYMLQVYKTILE